VLQAGKVMEAGPSQEIFRRPQADYTRMLLEAVPYFDPQRRGVALSSSAA
jgi:peptide/nickel transport system ATP-binding protein